MRGRLGWGFGLWVPARGDGLPAAGSEPGCVCARVRGAESPGLLDAWLCLSAAGWVSAGASGTHSRGGGQPGLSEPLGLG